MTTAGQAAAGPPPDGRVPEKLVTDRLALRPLPTAAAPALAEDRETASRALGAALDAEWPDPGLAGVLRRSPGRCRGRCASVWAMIERATVGDIGFHGPPDDAGTVELGYSVVPGRRRRGYATEAATALVAWARAQPGVARVVAGCDPANEPSVHTLRGRLPRGRGDGRRAAVESRGSPGRQLTGRADRTR